MIKIVKFAITLTALASALYFVFFVPLGSKTFYEHIKGISKTNEARRFQYELKNKVKETAKDLSYEIHSRSRRFSDDDKDLAKKTTQKDESAIEEPNPSDLRVPSAVGEEGRQAVLQIIREKTLPTRQDRDSLKQLVRKKMKNIE